MLGNEVTGIELMPTLRGVNADPSLANGGGGGGSVNRSLGDNGEQQDTLLVGSGACRPCEIIKNTMKTV